MRPDGSRISIVGRRSWPRRPRPWPSDKRPSWRRPRPWRNGGTNWSGPPSAWRRSQRTSQGRTASSPPSNRRSAGNPSNSSGGSASSRPRRGSLRGSEARPPGPWKRFKNTEAALLREHQAKQAELERRAREVEGKERAFAKETASLQELKGKLEQQEMDLLVKIREFGPREEAVAKAQATLARETAKLQKRAA